MCVPDDPYMTDQEYKSIRALLNTIKDDGTQSNILLLARGSFRCKPHTRKFAAARSPRSSRIFSAFEILAYQLIGG